MVAIIDESSLNFEALGKEVLPKFPKHAKYTLNSTMFQFIEALDWPKDAPRAKALSAKGFERLM